MSRGRNHDRGAVAGHDNEHVLVAGSPRHVDGDRTATEVGRYVILAADGQPADKGKYVVIRHRDDGGRWLIHRNIWASNLPLPSMA